MSNQKKCIVLDLDNTLWGGVAGEDGKDGIALAMDERGSAYMAFQQALRDLHDRGIILAINSHNNENDALDIIDTHPNMILKRPHFAAMRLNWDDKAENLRALAKELNIGLDSMVFLDDSPVQRELVKATLPEVEVPEMPTDPSLYTQLLLSLPYFETETITDEDKMRGNFYVTERLRLEAQKRYQSRDAFLESLGLSLEVQQDDTPSIARIAQLTEKTNQFNTNKRPYTEEEMGALMNDPRYAVFHARATDRFGDHGIIAVAIVEKAEAEWHVRTMLMSCRVFDRGIEQAFAHAIAAAARAEGASSVVFDFTPTEKNTPAQTFLETHTTDSRLENTDGLLSSWIQLLD